MDLGVVGSSPITHPIYRNGESARVGRSCLTGPSPSGKATDFDSVIALVRIQLAQPQINPVELRFYRVFILPLTTLLTTLHFFRRSKMMFL